MSAQQGSRLSALDLLRLVSALMVLVFHYGFRMAVTGEGGGIRFPEIADVAQWGEAGLLVFFTISGFVIALSAEGRSAWDFAVGRIARLWPAFVVSATITAVVLTAWPVPGIDAPSLKQWAAQFVLMSRLLGQPFMDNAYWTIGFELVFYGWVAVLMALGLFQRHWMAAIVVWLGLSIGNELVLDSNLVRKLFVTEYSGYFAFGILLFKGRERVDGRLLALMGLAALWAMAARLICERHWVDLYLEPRNVTLAALGAPLVLAVVAFTASLRTIPVRPGLATALGALTYPLYLLHQNIGYAVFGRFATGDTRWVVAGVLLAVLLAAAWAISTLIEPWARRAIVAVGARVGTVAAARFGRRAVVLKAANPAAISLPTSRPIGG
jgi:peptidoglycan/LPS O-acetylase OafA/YrhL